MIDKVIYVMKNIFEVGFGFWKVDKVICVDIIYEVIKVGYCYLDCVVDYGNEKEVGEGIKCVIDDGLCICEELWVILKFWNIFYVLEYVGLVLEKLLSDF